MWLCAFDRYECVGTLGNDRLYVFVLKNSDSWNTRRSCFRVDKLFGKFSELFPHELAFDRTRNLHRLSTNLTNDPSRVSTVIFTKHPGVLVR